MQLIADNRVGVHNQETKVSCVGEEVALDWLSKLDGRQHTLLSFERQDGWQLMVGGGPAQYIITLSDGSDNLTFCNRDGDETETIEICAGGQFGEFPKNICATYQQAARVIALFFSKNERQ
jgi:hypothetical protein